jgi:pseudaminic acid biosynthesis-associated methylase
MQTEQIGVWTSEFGRSYTERNRFSVDEFNALYVKRYGRARDDINDEFLADVARDLPVLEVGANIGNQLFALQRIGFKRLLGVELQRYCVDAAKEAGAGVDIVEGSAFDIPFRTGFFNLVFTNNVLIHISPDDLPRAMDEMYRVSGRYIMGFEYFAPEVTEIPYRGNRNLLWKADYGEMFLRRFADLREVRAKKFPTLDEPGLTDKLYLLEKRS